MKNIHILPTDKPSRFVTSKENKKCYLYSIEEFKDIDKFIEYDSKSWDSQNIYITNDEEIKEGDWVFDIFKNACPVIRQLKTEEEVLGVQKTELKIILTTDKYLIADGVQSIPDDFLEWFVKNPSCEEVEVEKVKLIFNEDRSFYGYEYKIIIPKTTQQIINEDFSGGLDMGQIIPKDEPKQSAVEWLVEQMEIKNPNWLKEEIDQAKEMEKQQKRYSEEDMKDYAEYYNAVANPKTPKDYFKK